MRLKLKRNLVNLNFGLNEALGRSKFGNIMKEKGKDNYAKLFFRFKKRIQKNI